MPNPSGEQDPSLLDEFYAECDEHLSAMRQVLARLGEAVGQPAEARRQDWERLMRQLHSLKGLMGMVGLERPERLAHAAEDEVRALSRRAAPLREEHLDALTVVAETLGHVLAAHRQQAPLPDVTPALERLQARAQEDVRPTASPPNRQAPAAGGARLEEEPLRQARQAGKRIWRFRFTPSPERNQRGVNINEVRRRLQALGELVHSAPVVEPGGAITFEFLLATEQEPQELAQWAAEGLTGELVEAPEAESAPAATAGPDLSAPAYVAPSQFVRVDLGRLDDLMQAMGEMVVNRARLEETLSRLDGTLPAAEARDLQEINASFARELRRLREGLMRVRLVPLADIFERMSLVVRDMVRESGRKIQLHVQGQETQIDKYIVERLKDPLLHLVRNAAKHGLEPTEERAAQGKPEALNIWLRASAVGESVLLQVADDGRGLQAEHIRARAEQMGLAVADSLTPAALLDILCQPGFSTKEEADLGAGRGVGMAVVKNTVLELGGELSLRTTPGRGTTFALRLPLTLAIADAMLIAVGNQKFALPQSGLQEITTVASRAIQRLEQTEFMRYREGVLPLVRLSQMFHLPATDKPEYPVMVLGHGAERLGVVAERILGQREIMVRALRDPLLKTPAVFGATELGDGRAVLILDALGLMEMARKAAA